MKIGLFFGSFNPIHTGHLLIASYMAGFTGLEQVWLVVSPQNPLKKKSTLANVYDRLEMARLATEGNEQIAVCDAELQLPLPSFTIDTLDYLSARYPQHSFSIIMGADTVLSLPKWKHADRILGTYPIFVYPRPGYDLSQAGPGTDFILTETPSMELSSTFVREAIRQKKSIRYWVPETVLDFIERKSLYAGH